MAVTVGVAGIIVMTIQLVDDDEPYPTSYDPQDEKLASSFKKDEILPTIQEADCENELSELTIENRRDTRTNENNRLNLSTVHEEGE